MLDDEALPDHRALLGVALFMTVVSVAVVLAPQVRPGYAVLSAPIAVGAFVLGVRAYVGRRRRPVGE